MMTEDHIRTADSDEYEDNRQDAGQYPPENIYDIYGMLLNTDANRVFSHLSRELANGNLDKKSIEWCGEGLSIAKTMMKIKKVKKIDMSSNKGEEEEEIDKSGFEFMAIHEVLARLLLSVSENMKGRTLYFTQNKKFSHEYQTKERRKKFLNMG